MKRILTVLAVTAFLASPAMAQQMGVVQGLIVDAETGESLIGANVIVYGPDKAPAYGTAADLDGRYSLKLPEGTHALEFSYVSYATKVVAAVQVTAGDPVTINISMAPEAIMGQEIVVTAKAVESSEAALLSFQQKASIVTDGISAELMSRASSSDAGDALKRVTGITVVGDKYVYVRGLGERYSNTQVNGARVPSPEPNRRVVPMDIFPAGLLENVQVAKTFSPDQPGDFSGGSVQIKTKDFPDRLTLNVATSAGYHSQTTFKDIRTYAGGAWDFLGFDDGSRAVPDVVKEMAADRPVRKRGRFSSIGFDADQIQTIGRSFSNVWSPRLKTASPNQSYSFSLGNAVGRGGRELGYLISLTYSNDNTNRSEAWNSYRLGSVDGVPTLTPFTTYDVQSTTNSVMLGTLLNASFRFSPFHKLGLKTIYNRSTDDEARIYEGYNSDRGTDLRDLRLRYVERGILSSQFSGEHHLDGLLKSNLDWSVNASRATRNEPDNREVLYEMRNGEWTFFDITQSGSRLFFDLADREFGGKADWTVPFRSPADLPAKLKMGGEWRDKNRAFEVRRFRFGQSSGIHRYVDLSSEPESLFAEANIAPGRFEMQEFTRPVDNYRAAQDVWAGYLMADMPLASRLRLIAGARVEAARQTLTSFDPFATTEEPVQVDLEDTDVLPGVNLVYKLSERSNLRSAYSRTLARPDFRELAPFEFTDFIGGRAVAGNPDLVSTTIDNYDLRFEVFPRLGELVAVSAFYKKFHDPIEQIIQPTAQLRVSYQNAASARNYGVEFEFRRRLDAVSPALEPFSVNANVTFVRSEVQIREGIGVQTSSNRALQGQSPYVVNVMLGYENLSLGTSANLLYNVFGRRISEVGAQGLPDVYEQPRHQIDFNVKQPLTDRVRLKLTAKNLLDHRVLYKQDQMDFRRYVKGRSFSVGFSYEL